jgi:L-seryl-tRNA(Ser) seleniumtransferase
MISVRSERISPNEIEARLRALDVPIVARISEDAVLIDLRTVDEEEFPFIREGFKSLAGPAASKGNVRGSGKPG